MHNVNPPQATGHTENQTDATEAAIVGWMDRTDINALEVVPVDLMSEYWTPESAGEQRRVYLSSISDRQNIDEATGEVRVLPTATFLYNDAGKWKLIQNSSIRLVSALQNHNLEPKTPLLITYLGKKRNSTNSFSSDNWSINMLKINKNTDPVRS